MATRQLTIPHAYTPRTYQEPFWNAMTAGCKRAVLVWHRRAGKDKSTFNWVVTAAMARVGTYYYFFPTFAQGRRVLWEGMDGDGFRFRDHLPPEIVATRKDGTPDMDETEMRVRLRNGSIIQIVGTDDYDKIRGTNPVGCVFSEYSYQDPSAWDTVQPILGENGGWAVFVYTPNGQNHGYTLFEFAEDEQRQQRGWFCQKLTVDDTKVIPLDYIESLRRQGIAEAFIQQEFYCSFDTALEGSYYGAQLSQAKRDGRIRSVPWEPELPVFTKWDIGMRDGFAVWFYQVAGPEIRHIDCYDVQGESLVHMVKVLREKPYLYEPYGHIAPHDIKVRELATGLSRLESAGRMGLHFTVAPKLPFDDGIDAVRRQFPRYWFDETKCRPGLRALQEYKKVVEEKLSENKNRPEFKAKPLHNWASHFADAMRTGATVNVGAPQRPMPEMAERDYNIFEDRRTVYPNVMRDGVPIAFRIG